MPKSILDAIKVGMWDFEPPEVSSEGYEPSDAMPGTRQKLGEMAERVRLGLPLWHERDRADMESPPSPRRPR